MPHLEPDDSERIISQGQRLGQEVAGRAPIGPRRRQPSAQAKTRQRFLGLLLGAAAGAQAGGQAAGEFGAALLGAAAGAQVPGQLEALAIQNQLKAIQLEEENLNLLPIEEASPSLVQKFKEFGIDLSGESLKTVAKLSPLLKMVVDRTELKLRAELSIQQQKVRVKAREDLEKLKATLKGDDVLIKELGRIEDDANAAGDDAIANLPLFGVDPSKKAEVREAAKRDFYFKALQIRTQVSDAKKREIFLTRFPESDEDALKKFQDNNARAAKKNLIDSGLAESEINQAGQVINRLRKGGMSDVQITILLQQRNLSDTQILQIFSAIGGDCWLRIRSKTSSQRKGGL